MSLNKTDLPSLELELEYAVEAAEDASDLLYPGCQVSWPEYCVIYAETVEKVDSMLAAFDEWESNRKASGAFVCDYCGRTHHHHAPPQCCAAHRAESDDGSDG